MLDNRPRYAESARNREERDGGTDGAPLEACVAPTADKIVAAVKAVAA